MNPESLLSSDSSEATTAVPPSVWLSERAPARPPARLQKFAARTSSLPFELSVRLSDVGRARRFNVPLAALCLRAGRPANGSRHCRQFAMDGFASPTLA